MRGLRELMGRKEHRWWCGAGHSTTQENACTTPVLPNEKFCSVAHMEQEVKLHDKVREQAREIPLLQTRNRIRNDFAQYVADNIAIDAPITYARCTLCGAMTRLACESGRVTEIRPGDHPIGSRQMLGRTQITFTYWVTWPMDHVCQVPEGASGGQEREGMPGHGSESAAAGDGLSAERGSGDRGTHFAGHDPEDCGAAAGGGGAGTSAAGLDGNDEPGGVPAPEPDDGAWRNPGQLR